MAGLLERVQGCYGCRRWAAPCPPLPRPLTPLMPARHPALLPRSQEFLARQRIFTTSQSGPCTHCQECGSPLTSLGVKASHCSCPSTSQPHPLDITSLLMCSFIFFSKHLAQPLPPPHPPPPPRVSNFV